MPADGAGNRIKSLLENCDTCKQAVAIAVQRVDGGGEAPGFIFVRFGDGLELLRLPGQIGGDLFVPESGPRMVRQNCDDHGADGADAPGPKPPKGTTVEFLLLGQKAGQPAAAFIGKQTLGQILLISSP